MFPCIISDQSLCGELRVVNMSVSVWCLYEIDKSVNLASFRSKTLVNRLYFLIFFNPGGREKYSTDLM